MPKKAKTANQHPKHPVVQKSPGPKTGKDRRRIEKAAKRNEPRQQHRAEKYAKAAS